MRYTFTFNITIMLKFNVYNAIKQVNFNYKIAF